MPLLTALRSLIEYKEPQNIEGFEFVEDKYEDSKPKEQKHSTQNTIGADLKSNLDRMKKEFNVPKNIDIIIREFKIARKTNAFIIYMDGMINKDTVNEFILRQLMTPVYFDDFKQGSLIDYILDNVLSINQIIKENKYEKIINYILCGLTVVFIDGCEECLTIENQGYEKRSVDKPVTENVIRGPQEGFSENLRTNVTLIRKIVRNKDLITEIFHIDKRNNTSCAMLYINNLANPTIVKEVKRRITGLNIDFVPGNGLLEELISDHVQMPFPQISTTERPDRAAANIMDGKVILVTDGSPFVSSIPFSFFEALQSPEDFSLKWQFASFLRYLRLFALFVTLLVPGLYAAVTLFHQEMIPTELLNSIAQSRENVPFPTIVDIVLMEVSFELIREGGIRVPGVIGNTLGIVGALILGQAAAQAQLVSPILIIIIAIVGISSFAIPSFSMAFSVRLLRFVFILFGSIVGFYGIAVALVIILGLACSLKSFGVPYFVPVAPKTKANPDVIATLPAYKQKIRADFTNSQDKNKTGEVTEEWLRGKDSDKE